MRKSKVVLLFSVLGVISFGIINTINTNFNPVYASNKPELEQSSLTLDIYAEYDFKLTNYNENLSYTWTSSNTNIATIDNDGHLSCLGKVGDIVITVKCGKESDTCNVSIKNQMMNPSISVEDCLGFVNVEAFPEVEVRYDDNYYPLTDYTLTSKDTSVAVVTPNGGFMGKQVGEVEIVVNGVWKGKTLKSKKFTANIQPENSIVLDQEIYDVYSVDETSPVRKNYVEINAEIYLRGQKVDDPVVVDLGSNTYLESEGNKVIVINNHNGDEPLLFNATVYCSSKPEVSVETTIRLFSNYEAKVSSEEISETYQADIDFRYEEFEGHPNAYRYEITNHEMNKNTTNPVWSSWNTRIEFYETTTKNGVVAYDYMMEKGYTILSFDYYYCGEKGILMGAYGAPAKQYFYNEVQINRTDMLLVNEEGQATNILTNDQWYTVYIDISEVVLKSMTIGQDAASLYVGPCYVGDVSYFDNIRYYYDYSPLNNIEILFDVEERELLVDEDNQNKASSPNEMIVYSPNYVSYTLDESLNLYTYNSENALELDRESRSKINAANLLNGYAVNKGYKYLAFDYIYTSGTPILSYFNNFTNSIKSITLDTTAKTNNFISFYKDGKPIDSIVVGELINVVVRIDGRVNDSLYLSSKINTLFNIGNFNYYKDTSYIHDYSYNEPFKVVVDNVDFGFVGEEVDLSKYVSVIYDGKVVTNPNLSGFRFSNRKAEYLGGTKVSLKETGVLEIRFVIRVNEVRTDASITITIKEDSSIYLPEANVSLYAGDKDYFEKEHYIQPFAIYNQELISSESLVYELVNDNGVLDLSLNKITALKVGEEQIKISLPDNSQSVTLNVDVFNEYRKGSFTLVLQDTTSPATYNQVEETVYGVENPFKYQASTASWNNKLDITETKHTTTSSSKNNIINGHIDFITYWILLTPNTTLRAACVNPSGGHSNITLSVGGTINLSNNTNIKVLNDANEEVDTLSANVWYQIVVDYSNFEEIYKSGYTCHELVYLKGTCYVSDIRYYHDSLN